ncbi:MULTISPECIES: tRNA (guanosine(46)-N7)-methyltransferase TrmB [Kosmotoga]|uniref:tRNA (guanine-N(7)-)-methyltransferase n=1 Tax=Kosmotoga olearia (strain ATCC BAA-1733 / DSM 21960 / TBF 19.5.1) TaxID=521045 RepID=C5CH93_KOSOT|nr:MULTISPECIES: tRNA (guanosine(46)-N7)-methyltransferase TrmB [Kosmotoga]ACR78732.1 tRNA (guanine-N(7)-)-methyltransferase [Kosmotoga olearia TBF 19.5.1]MDI3524152.1 tRNA (guanine-N7-)-methyltransferase [Kosmotoga sp.]OAA25527.1 hypothetical protein DU53_00030 [Kosmotoga sp. DU53]
MCQDFTKFYVEPRLMNLPMDLDALFTRSAPLFLEVGFGNGEFLIENALNRQGHNFLGIELSVISMVKIMKRLSRENIENVKVMMVDAKFGVRELFPDESVDGLYMNFPCPWPRERHSGKRLNTVDFLLSVAAVLKKGGMVQLYTDSLEFAEVFAENLGQTSCFIKIELIKNPPQVNTRYERKWKREGREIYKVTAEKLKTPMLRRIAGGDEMPHTWIKELKPENLKKILNSPIKKDIGVFVYKSMLKDLDDDRYLVETIAIDGDFQQHFYVEIHKRNKGWLVKLDSHGLPFRTPAVKKAVYELGKILEKRRGAL